MESTPAEEIAMKLENNKLEEKIDELKGLNGLVRVPTWMKELDMSTFDPQLHLRSVLIELGIDWKAPNFTFEDMFYKIQRKIDEHDIFFWDKYRF